MSDRSPRTRRHSGRPPCGTLRRADISDGSDRNSAGLQRVEPAGEDVALAAAVTLPKVGIGLFVDGARDLGRELLQGRLRSMTGLITGASGSDASSSSISTVSSSWEARRSSRSASRAWRCRWSPAAGRRNRRLRAAPLTASSRAAARHRRRAPGQGLRLGRTRRLRALDALRSGVRAWAGGGLRLGRGRARPLGDGDAAGRTARTVCPSEAEWRLTIAESSSRPEAARRRRDASGWRCAGSPGAARTARAAARRASPLELFPHARRGARHLVGELGEAGGEPPTARWTSSLIAAWTRRMVSRERSPSRSATGLHSPRPEVSASVAASAVPARAPVTASAWAERVFATRCAFSSAVAMARSPGW